MSEPATRIDAIGDNLYRHVEADECGALNDFLDAAPQAPVQPRRRDDQYRRPCAAPAGQGADSHANPPSPRYN